jgi:hypothetical protein
MTEMASILHRNNKSIRFDAALNWEDEDRRTAHGVEVRRERKQRKKQRKMFRAQEIQRVHAASTILRETGKVQAVFAVWRNVVIRSQLTLFLSEAGVPGDIYTLDQQMTAFQDPKRVFRRRDLNGNALAYLKIITSLPEFMLEYFPASIISSSSSEESSGTESFNRDELHAAANADDLANAAARQDLNQDNAPNEDGAEGNENGNDAAAAPEDDVV